MKDNFSPQLFKIASNTKQFSSQLRSAEARANHLTKSISKFVKVSAGITTAAAGAFVGSSLKTYESFEQAMANTAGLSGITQTSEEYARLEKAARDAGKLTTKTAEESAQALGYMALAGWNVDDSINGLMPILRMSEATQSDLATTSDLVTDSMSAMGLSVDDLTHYLDVATMANNKSNQTANQLMEAYTQVGGTFNRLGTPIEESSALLGVLANRGMKGSEAGNSLNSLMINLTKKTGESAKALKTLGINAYDSEGNFKGVTNVLKELNEKTKNLTPELRDTFYTMIGGKTQITTLNNLMAGLNTTNAEGVSELDALRGELENADGSLDSMADTVNNTMHGAFARMGSAIDDLKIEVGKKLAPYITSFVNGLAEKLPAATQKFGEMVDRIIPQVEAWFKKAVDIFNKLKVHSDLLLPAISAVAGGFGAFIAITKVTGFMSKLIKTGGKLTDILKLLNLTMLANPFTWIAVGIGVLIGVFVYAYQKSETFRQFIQKLWDKLKEFGEGIKTGVIAKLQELGSWFDEKLRPKIKRLWDMLKEFGEGIKTGVIAKLQELGSWFDEKLRPKIEKLQEAFMGFWNNVLKPILDKIREALMGFWNNVLKPIAEWLQPVFAAQFQAAFTYISDTINTVIETIKGVISGLITALTGILDFITGVFTGDWELAWNGIKEIFSGVFEGVKAIFKGVINFIIDKINYFTGKLSWIPEQLSKIPGFSWAVDFKIPKIPNFATGTQYFGGGLAQINERGGEIVNLHSGAQIIPADQSKKMINQRNPSITIHLNIAGNLFGVEESAKQFGSIITREVMLALENI